MVHAYHAILSTYGFWLPNDPRGSWSDWVRKWEILQYGEATKVSTRRSVAARPHSHAERRRAKTALRHPPVVLTGRQAQAVCIGFKQAAEESGYVVHACSILPTHTHLVIARHRHKCEQIVGHLKGRATQKLTTDGIHPLARFRSGEDSPPSPWGRGLWKVYLDNAARIRRAIEYVEHNPMKEGRRPQRWSLVTPFVGLAGTRGKPRR